MPDKSPMQHDRNERTPTRRAPDRPPEDPQQIGPYRILQQIGQGGMGSVYLAEQQHPVRRRVALKLVKLGMDTRQVVARFESERQALALMNHANVAAVYDAGSTEAGRPYFVMEYVAGEPITQYCDRHRLSIPERLALFMQACHAVQHAHTKGIIHRDIKPSNVLVVPEGAGEGGQDATSGADRRAAGTVKVIDFGVAKATNQRLTEHTVFTEMGQLIGTPEYMSPEQAEMNQLDIDTRTDVYSLGVLLYELLTGSLPFDSATLRRAGYAEIQRIIREVEPPRPSTRLSSAESRQAPMTAATPGQADTLGAHGPISTAALDRINQCIEYATDTNEFDGDVQSTSPQGERTPVAVNPSDPKPRTTAEIAAARRTDPRALHRKLRGDLDWIVMKCLEKDRTRRYETANGVALEIQRYLVNEPVLAGPPSPSYRIRKFTRRNRGAVIAGGLIAAAMIGATGISLVFARSEQQQRQMADVARLAEQRERQQAEQERETARREADKARSIQKMLESILASINPDQQRGADVTVRQMLDETRKRIAGELAGQPEVLAAVWQTMGRAYAGLRIGDAADECLTKSVQLYRQLSPTPTRELADSLFQLASVPAYGETFRQRWEQCKEAVQIYESLLPNGDPVTIDAKALLVTLSARPSLDEWIDEEAFSGVLMFLGAVKDADYPPYLRERVAICRNLLKEDGVKAARAYANESLHWYFDQVAHRANAGDMAGARQLLRDAIQPLESIPVIQDFALRASGDAIHGARALGSLPVAEALAREYLRFALERFEEPHLVIADQRMNLAHVLQARGNHTEAAREFRQALRTRRKLLGDESFHVRESAVALCLAGVPTPHPTAGFIIGHALYDCGRGLFEMAGKRLLDQLDSFAEVARYRILRHDVRADAVVQEGALNSIVDIPFDRAGLYFLAVAGELDDSRVSSGCWILMADWTVEAFVLPATGLGDDAFAGLRHARPLRVDRVSNISTHFGIPLPGARFNRGTNAFRAQATLSLPQEPCRIHLWWWHGLRVVLDGEEYFKDPFNRAASWKSLDVEPAASIGVMVEHVFRGFAPALIFKVSPRGPVGIDVERRVLGSGHMQLTASIRGAADRIEKEQGAAAADQFYEAQIDIERRLGDAGRMGRLVLLDILGERRLGCREFEATIAAYRESIECRRAIKLSYDEAYIRALGNLGEAYRQFGFGATTEPDRVKRHAAAEEFLREAVEAEKIVSGPDHPHVLDRLRALCWNLGDQGRRDEAAAVARERLALARKIAGDDNQPVIEALETLSYQQASNADVELTLRQALDLSIVETVRDLQRETRMAARLAIAIAAQGRDDEADRTFREALATSRAGGLGDELVSADLLLDMSRFAGNHGNFDEAERLSLEAIAIRKQREGAESWNHAFSLYDLGWWARNRKQFGRSADYFQQAANMFRGLTKNGGDDRHLANTLMARSYSLIEQGRLDEAERDTQEAVTIRRRIFGDDHLETAAALADYGDILRRRGDFVPAEAALREFYRIRLGALGPSHELTRKAAEALVWLAQAAHDPAKEAEFRQLLEVSATRPAVR